MSRRSGGEQSLWAIFRVPLIVGVLSLIGLIGALLVEGPADGLFGLMLASTVVVTLWALMRRRR